MIKRLFLVSLVFVSQSAQAINLCRFVFAESKERAMALSILNRMDESYRSDWAKKEQIRQTADKQFGSDVQFRDLFVLEAHEQSRRALTLMVAREIAWRGINVDENQTGFQLKLMGRLRLIVKSRAFEYFAAASSLYFSFAHVGLPYIPEVRLLKLNEQEIQVLIEKGVSSAEGEQVIQKKARLARLQGHVEWLRKSYLVLTMGFAAYLMIENSDKQTELDARRAFLELFNHFENIDRSKTQPRSKQDLHYELTLQGLEHKYQKRLSQGERRELCSLIKSTLYCG